ncbi:MAG TPA: hypothetical protein VFM50_04085, partial [Nocardioidaceae bacterium]|nr:hypothetical protein [Nocardioidaceae bacterium]
VVLADGAPKGCRLSEGSSEKPWTVTCSETATALTIPLGISRPNVDAGALTATLHVPHGYYAPTPPTATVPLSAIEVQESPADPRLSVSAWFLDPLGWLGLPDDWRATQHPLILHARVSVGSPVPELLEYTLHLAPARPPSPGRSQNERGPVTFASTRACASLLECLLPSRITCETVDDRPTSSLTCPVSGGDSDMWFLVDVPPGQRDKTVLTVTALDDTQRQVTVPVQPPADGVPSDGTGG